MRGDGSDGAADTTGLAALALAAAGSSDAVLAAADFLVAIQDAEGGVLGFGLPNANSTAIAGQAFVAAGNVAAADAAASFLEGLQFPSTSDPSDAGGLGFLPGDSAANTFATIQGVWGMGVPALFEVVAPEFGFDDVPEASTFADDIAWVAAAGITNGCAEDAFCPDDPVTRGQMAALLNRALKLDPGVGSAFVDIDGSVFADDIEAIAAAGITNGCTPDRFCPTDHVTRGQMAAFLARAFSLAAASDAGFVDIEESVFVDDINAIAAVGITNGCAADRFCPDDPVTRGQMAAFVRRALSA